METISIIMPAFNSERFIGEAIQSVIAQSYEQWELVVVDDCSTDSTYDIVETLARQEPRISCFRLKEQGGPAVARNLAIAKAEGRFVAFLDSDDLWAKDKLAKQVPFAREKQAALSFTAYEKIDEAGAVEGRVVSVPPSIDYRGLLKASIIGCLTAMYDTQITGKVYMPEILKRQDYGLWLKILKAGHLAYGLNEPLAYLRKRRGSVSSNKVVAAAYVWKLFREVEQLSVPSASYYFLNYAVRAFIKSKI